MDKFERSIAISIGINSYRHGIATLQTAVADAQNLADVLQREHGYTVETYLDADASLQNLRSHLKNLSQQITDHDRLLIYFAGHGIAKESNQKSQNGQSYGGPVGFLIPQDARPEDESTFLPMQELYEALASLPCQHLLLILDCCFAGAFRWANTRDLLIPEKMYRQRFERFQNSAAWQVLTSASQDQKALDILRDNRSLGQTSPQHSPFASALFEALAGEADLIRDEVITATELYLYLRDAVEDNSDEQQTPGLWPLPKHDRGEFFFLSRDFDLNNLEQAPTPSPELNPYRGLQSYDEHHGTLFFGRDQLVKTLYHDYVLPHPLTVVVGASGTGKSSLVKAGLIPYLRQAKFLRRRREFADTSSQVTEKWYVLPILRPGNDPLLALAQVMFPLVDTALSDQALAALAAFQSVVAGREQDLPASFIQTWAASASQPKTQMLLALEWDKTLQDRLRTQSADSTESDLEALRQLTQQVEHQVCALADRLQQDNALIQSLWQQWLRDDHEAQVLLVIDQAEELVTQTQQDSRRQCFIQSVQNALAAHPHQLHCVLTVRMDFEPLVMPLFKKDLQQDCAETYPRLVVPPMAQDELRDAIKGPANEAVLHFEPASLVDELINEVVQMPGALPLLSFTLSELYIRCVERFHQGDLNRALTQEDYEALGQVGGALRTRANAELRHVVEKWGKAGERTLRNIMLRMVALEGGELARRQVPRTELVYADPAANERVADILQRLIEQRLVISGRTSEGEYVEPAHDFLVRGWEKIDRWLNETVKVRSELTYREHLLNVLRPENQPLLGAWQETPQLAVDVVLQRQLTAAAKRWLSVWEQDEKEGYNTLWTRDPRLATVKQVTSAEEGKRNWLNDPEAMFVGESLKRKQTLRRRWVIGTTGVVGAIVLVAGVAISQRHQAVLQSRKAQRQTVRALNQAATAQLESEAYFDALLEATRAGSLIQQNTHLSHNSDLVSQTWSKLHSAGEYLKVFYQFSGVTFDFSPNEQYFASGSEDGKVKLWHMDGTLMSLNNSVHTGGVTTVHFSPDGQHLISGGMNGEIKFWQINASNTNQVSIKDEDMHKDQVDVVSFSPDGQHFASWSRDNKIKLWEINSSGVDLVSLDDRIPEGADLSANIRQLEFSPDGQYLAFVSGIGNFHLWQMEERNWTYASPSISLPRGSVSTVAFGPDSRYLAMGDTDGQLSLWQVSNPNWISVPLGNSRHEDDIATIQFSPNGQYLASSTKSVVKQWQLEKPDITLIDDSVDSGSFGAAKLRFSPDSQYLAIGTKNSRIKLWKMSKTQANPIDLPAENNFAILTLEFSPDSQYLASGSYGGKVNLWKLQDQNQRWIRMNSKREERPVVRLKFSADSKYLASLVNDNEIKLQDADNEIKLWRIDGTPFSLTNDMHGDEVTALAFSSDNKYVTSGGKDGRIKLWQVNGNTVELENGVHQSKVIDLQFSPSSQYLVSGGQDGQVKLWQINSGLATPVSLDDNLHELKNRHSQQDQVTTLRFSPDSKYLASRGRDGQFKFWQINGTTAIVPDIPYIDKSGVSAFEYSSDGKHIALGRDGQIQLWQIGSNWVDSINIRDTLIHFLKFSPDGQYLAAGGLIGEIRKDADGKVKLWQLGKNSAELPDLFNSNGNSYIDSLEFSPNSQYIASSIVQFSESPMSVQVKLWKTNGTPVPLEDATHLIGITELRFSPDDKYFISFGKDRKIKLWDMHGAKVDLPNSLGYVDGLEFSPNGKYIAFGHSNRVELWQINEAETKQPISLHNAEIASNMIEFSPDGKYLVSGGRDGQVKLLPFDLAYLMQRSCNWLQFYINANSHDEKSKEEIKELCPNSSTAKTAIQEFRTMLPVAVNSLLLTSYYLASNINRQAKLQSD
ncbi:MAG: caspase family protein [Leptolyngbyaceae cyanobacterium]